jgi:hypothetical protein
MHVPSGIGLVGFSGGGRAIQASRPARHPIYRYGRFSLLPLASPVLNGGTFAIRPIASPVIGDMTIRIDLTGF